MYPDYRHSLVSVTASLLRYFGVRSDNGSLPALDTALAMTPKRVAILLFDGLGVAQLERYLPQDSFLRANMADRVSSVFPSTTVAAMNSYYSGLYPIQHGWLGWSLYFKEFGRAIDVFPRLDSVSKQKIPATYPVWNMLSYPSVPDLIEGSSLHSYERGKNKVVTIMPPGIGIPGSSGETVSSVDLDHFFDSVERSLSCRLNAYCKSLTLAYWPDPDMTLHKKGGKGAESEACVRDLDARCAALAERLDEDTLLVVSADHGHVDVDSYVDIDLIPGLVECLVLPPFLETRAAMFYVKQERRNSFEEIFRNRLSRSFALFTREEIFSRELFGFADAVHPAHPKTDDFIGDYLIVAIGNQGLKYYEPDHDHSRDFASHHAGLTMEEMLIPLVLYSPHTTTSKD
jgi:predicted AlkP superfamily pyrophosphatase or phosphodiesterase